MKTGTELIAEERARQISEEGWTPAHDDDHEHGQIALAAACYALPCPNRENEIRSVEVNLARGFSDPDDFYSVPKDIPRFWPWDAEWWKPSPEDRVRELVKAGALIAAEIDRLQRDTAGGGR